MSDNAKLSRRSFFKLAGGGVAAAIAAPYAIAEAVTRIPVELGWTWFIDKTKVDPSLAELVSNTLRNNKNKIIDNMFEKNALYAKLSDGKKILIEVERISPEDQTQRMKVRMQHRFEEKTLKAKKYRLNESGLDNKNKQEMMGRTKLALENKELFELEDGRAEPDGSITYYDKNFKKIANVKIISISPFKREVKYYGA